MAVGRTALVLRSWVVQELFGCLAYRVFVYATTPRVTQLELWVDRRPRAWACSCVHTTGVVQLQVLQGLGVELFSGSAAPQPGILVL